MDHGRKLKDAVDDPADAFEYDEHACLVSLSPEAFDFFMLAVARPARVDEVRRSLRALREALQRTLAEPDIVHELEGVKQLLAASQARLQAPLTQLALMRLSAKCHRATKRFTEDREEERRIAAWLQF